MTNCPTPRRLLTLLAVLALLEGCGQKGPLYFPDPQQESKETTNNESANY